MMENKIKCLICGKEVTNNNSYIGSHVKRVHKILLNEYVEKYYKNTNTEFKIEKCGFCNNNAIPNIIINHLKNEYEYNYNNGYFCQINECRNNISLLILNTPYNKKTYEHIGSKSNYLSLLYKIDIEDAKKSKTLINKICDKKSKTNLEGYILRYGDEEGTKKYIERNDKISKTSKLEWYIDTYGNENGLEKWKYKNRHKSSLEGFILKYGEEEGTIKYKERCDKIGKTNRLEWYIEKFGKEIGNKKWNDYTNKLKSINQNKQSKSSEKIKKILENLNIKYEEEYQIKKINKYCDFFIDEYNTIIEFYGDYWHCNPIKYEKNYYHQYIKMTAEEIWEKNKKRINEIYNFFNKEKNIIIIWESSMINSDLLLKILIENKNNIIYI